jgi:hypothetical protein
MLPFFGRWFPVVVLVLSGCASVPPPRSEVSNIPVLDNGYARIYLTAGTFVSAINRGAERDYETGPVFVNGKQIGSTAKHEYVVLDLLPGTYEANWVPSKPNKFKSEKVAITVRAGDIRYFVGDLESTAGMHFGLIGDLASDYRMRGYFTEKSGPCEQCRVVSYTKYQ